MVQVVPDVVAQTSIAPSGLQLLKLGAGVVGEVASTVDVFITKAVQGKQLVLQSIKAFGPVYVPVPSPGSTQIPASQL